MKIKKQACAALAACVAVFSTGFTAHAQVTEVNCNIDYGVITFSGKTEALARRVTYTAFKANSDDILSIGEPDVYEDGSFLIQTGFETSGDYKIVIKDADGSIYEKTIDGYICLEDRKETLLNQINVGGEAEIKTALDEMNLEFEGAEWADLTDTNLTSWLLKYIKEHRTYTGIDEVENEYAKLNALYIISKTKVASIVSKVREYAEILGISDDSQVKAFLSGASNAQKSALVLELSDNPATTPQMLKESVKKANDAKKQEGSSGGGGGSGGGSGGSGGAIISEIGKETETEPEIENSPVIQTETFSDLAQAEWARVAIENLVSKGVISGVGDGTFRPNNNVTREEFVKMIVIAFGIPYEGKECAFLDVFENDWFRTYVGAAQECGLINGISNDIFGIHKEITRQDAAVILKRVADYTGLTLNAVREYKDFADRAYISDYAREAVIALYRNGTVNGKGDGCFAPKDTCTRAEAAKMIYEIVGGQHL